jgi:tetratricopeptide (TPR) repeat protein
MTTEPSLLAEQGKQAFSAGKFARAAEIFSEAATGYSAVNDALNAAEMKNNQCVALSKIGKAQEALQAITGTDKVFEEAGDVRRQGMALGNQAEALESLGRLDEALAAYERSAALLAEAGESELRAIVLQAIAALKLRRGKMMDAAFSMIGSIETAPKPNLLQRLLRFLLRSMP